jgi:hypothetical protein
MTRLCALALALTLRRPAQVLHPAERPAGGPSPVVLFLGAANVPAESYTWLAAALVANGYVAVLPSAVLRYGPEAVLLPLPYDVAALASWEAYRRGPAAEGCALLLDELRKLNDARGGPLHNALDLNAVVVGVRAKRWPSFLDAAFLEASDAHTACLQGHGTGGRAALELVAYGSTFPEIAGAFSYGATLDNEPSRPSLDRPGAVEGTLRPFQRFAPPLLLLGGSADASLAAEVAPGSGALDCVAGLRRLLWQGVEGGSGDGPEETDADEPQGGTTGGAVLAILEGGGFGTPCWPLDPAAAASDPDFALAAPGSDAEAEQAALRATMAQLLVHWLDARVAPPGWLPGDDDEDIDATAGARDRDPSIAATADGLGMPLYASRSERAFCWPPEPDEYRMVSELKCAMPLEDVLAAFAGAPPEERGDDGTLRPAHAGDGSGPLPDARA